MTEKEKYINQTFTLYNLNKKRLEEFTFDSVRGVDYSRLRTNTNNPTGNENALVNHLDEKRKIEKQIEIVDHVLWFYKLDGNGKDEYIKQRYLQGKKLYQIAIDLYASDKTLMRWDKDIKATAARCADMYGLW